MTADIELLPLPRTLQHADDADLAAHVQDYARANVEHYVKELQEEVARVRGLWGDAEILGHKLYDQNAAKDAEIEALRAEVDEARGLVTEANNSLYGSQAYFHSLDGGPYNKHHLANGIEDLKGRARAGQQPAAVDGAMVERAARAWCAGTDTPFDQLPDAGKARCLEDMRVVLTAALAAQPGGSDNDR